MPSLNEPDEMPLPKWFYPPEGRAWTVDDLDSLPEEAPRRLEIIDGALIVMSPQSLFHIRAIDAINVGLQTQLPADLMVIREWTVVLPDGNGPEPDIVVIDRKADHEPEQTRIDAAHVRMVVEVVSPDSRQRDFLRKPQLYAGAGIEHYWIVDNDSGSTVVRTYHLDPAGGYQPTGEHRDQVKLSFPFPIELDLSEAALYE